VRSGFDELRPDEQADHEERKVLDVVNTLMPCQAAITSAPAGRRSNATARRSSRRRPSTRRTEAVSTKKSSGPRNQGKCGRGVPEQDVLQHVSGEQVLVACLVER